MSNCTFQAQLVSIMEILAKAAVAEINRRVDDSCAVIRVEMTRSQRDIDVLKRKCQLMENELRRTRGRGRKRVSFSGASDRLSQPLRSVWTRERSATVWREQATVPEETPLQPPHNAHTAHTTVHILEDGTESLLIKEESAEEELWSSGEAVERVSFDHGESDMHNAPPEEQQVPPAEDLAGQDAHLTHFTHTPSSGELPEQARCGGGEEEELGALAFQVKAEEEEEEEEKAARQAGCERGAGEADHLEFVLDERDAQLWTSVADGDATAPRLSHGLALFPAAAGAHAASAGQARADARTQPVWDAEGPPGLDHAARAQSRDRLRSVDGAAGAGAGAGGGVSLSLQQRFRNVARATSEGTTGSNMSAAGQSGSGVAPGGSGQPFGGYAARGGGGGFGAVRRLRTHWRAAGVAAGDRRFSCSFCEKSFTRFSQLKEHLRSHTGEKPYSCAQCGRSFTKQCNLIRHAVVHSGEKPYQCSQCGKCFTQRSSLKSHQRTHVGGREGALQGGLAVCGAGRDPHSSLMSTHSRGFL